MTPRVIDFFLHVMRSEDGIYYVSADCEMGGQSTLTRIANSDIEDLKNVEVDFSIKGLEAALDIGHRVFECVFVSDVRDIFEKSRAEAAARSVLLRIVLKLEKDPALQEIPWELMHTGYRAVALDPSNSIVRYIAQPNSVKSLRISKNRLRILFTMACPPEVVPLDLERERKIVENALVPLGASVILDVRDKLSFEALEHKILSANAMGEPYHIWHHCGHGGIARSTGAFVLILENEGRRQQVSSDEIGVLMQRAPSLRLAILNTCHSGEPSGLATSLAALNIPATIGLRGTVLDSVSVDFTSALYRGLLQLPVDFALQAARRELFDSLRPLDWALPLLFLRTTDANLIE